MSSAVLLVRLRYVFVMEEPKSPSCDCCFKKLISVAVKDTFTIAALIGGKVPPVRGREIPEPLAVE